MPTTTDGDKKPGSFRPKAQINDEHDDGGFGHTPWGVGLQHRFSRAFVPGEAPAPGAQHRSPAEHLRQLPMLARIKWRVMQLLGRRRPH